MPFLLGRKLNGKPWSVSVGASPVTVTGITLTPATGRANSASGVIVGTLQATTAGGALVNPIYTLVSTAGGDFQLVNGNQVAFLPSNVPAGSYNVTAQVASDNAATYVTPAPGLAITISAAAVVPPVTVPTGNANRYDVTFDQSVVAPGGTVTGKLIPNGLWSGGTVTLTPGAGAAVNVTLPSSGSAAATFSFAAPSIGDDYFIPTNSAGLVNPWPAQVNVFAASSGTSHTFTPSLPGTAPDYRTHQRDTASGAPNGFPSSFTRGWGQVQINIASLSGATDGVWVRLYDATSSGATATAGTGAALHSSPVQIHGALGASGTISPLLPASASTYWADLATDAAFTAPVRVPQRFRVGVVIGHMSRSQETGLERDYAGAGGGRLAQFYSKTATWAAYDHRYPNTDSGWFLQDGSGPDPYQYHYGEVVSSGPQEIGRLLEAQLGVCCGITGVSDTGGGLDVFFNHDGTLASGFDGTVAASVGRKFRYAWIAMGGWEGSDQTNYPTETLAESRTRMLAAIPKFAAAYPACAVIAWVAAASGWFGNNGSNDIGYTRMQTVLLKEAEPVNPMVVSKESTLWNELYSGHATQIARLDYIRPGFRLLMAAETATMGGLQTANRGPTLGSTAVISGRTISVPYVLHGGTALTSVKAVYSDPTVAYSTANSAELAPLFSVYAGSGGRNGAGLAIKISTATINASAGTIDLALVGTTGVTFSDGSTAAMPSVLTVNYAADFGASAPAAANTGTSLCDDRSDLGIPYGWLARPQLDIVVTAFVPMSQQFTVSNWGSASSATVLKRNAWFKKGDVPAGSMPVVDVGTAQFYAISRWSDGSMKAARLLLRDSPLAASANRNYTMTTVTGALAAGSTAATGNAGLVSALAGHSFAVSFSNVQTWDCSSPSGNYAPLGSGAFTASLATHAAVSTRCTLLTTGPVADVWQVWGMAADKTSGTADAHLKVNWYVTRWKNADGSTLAFQIGVVVALDWWSVANKFFLQYDAVFADGAAQIVSFPGVKHHYQSQWLMCVNDGGLNAGTAPWIGAMQPTLWYSFDRVYAGTCGVFPPLDPAKRPAPATQYAYVPCGVVADPSGSSHTYSHRTGIDAAGGYNGRGVVTRFDSDAFMAGTPQAYAVARLNALSGLGVPYHYRSNRQRTRPGESADTANTIIPLLMAPLAVSASDFTTQGLPIAVDAYNASTTNGAGHDGFVWQTGVTTATSNGYPYYRTNAEPAGTMGPWQTSIDASHAVSYCYFMAAVSGDEWLVEAQLDLAMNLGHQGIYGFHNYQQLFPKESGWNASTPADYWTGLLAQFQADNQRSLGWSQLVQGHAFGLLPADHVAYGYTRALTAHQGDYIAGNLDNLPSDFAAAAFYAPESQLGLNNLYSPWMNGFVSACAYAHYLLNEDFRWKRLGDFCAAWSVAQAAAGRWYAFDLYRTIHRRKRASWDAATNPELPIMQQPVIPLTANYVSGTKVFTATSGFWGEEAYDAPPLTNGDAVTLTTETDGGSGGVLPPGGSEGQLCYIVNLTAGGGRLQHNSSPNGPTFQLAASVGGAPLSFGADTAGCNLGVLSQSVTGLTPASSDPNNFLLFPYIPNWGDYVPIHVSVLMLGRLAGNTAITPAMRDGALAFTAPMDASSGYYSAFDMATLV